MTIPTTPIYEHGPLTMSRNGAHLLSAQTSKGNLLYLSSTSEMTPGSAIRGGVPVVAPWFATFLGDTQHGYVRTNDWEITATDHGFRAEYAHDGLAYGLDASLADDALFLRLTIENTTAESRPIQMLFHPYLSVSDVEAITISGLDGATGTDRLTDEEFTVNGDIHISGEHDRIMHTTSPVTIVDGDRTLTITSSGADSTVIWNPGKAKADTLTDLGAGEWKRFVCVEPGLLGDDLTQGVTLSPGEINTLELTVS